MNSELFLAAFMAASAPAWSQWTYPGCTDVTATQFSYTTVVPAAEVWEPSDLAVAPDGSIFYTELDEQSGMAGARVRRRSPTGTFQTVATLPIWEGPYGQGQADIEEGLTGIVLDPNFATNGFVYIHWSPANAVVYRISRFTFNGTTLGSERIVLDIPAQRDDCCHTGGGMAFDDDGDLWISQGNNGGRGVNGSGVNGIGISNTKYLSDEWGASSTGGLRGGILRIHPTATGTPTYTDVAGNFKDYFAGQGFDGSKIRPEIYTKGSRNCYKMAVDPVRKWVGWSDVGPDGPTVSGSNTHEEFNIRTTPAFMGWPYFVGNNLQYSGGKTAATPTNTSTFNTQLNGLTTLPPAQPAFYSEGRGSNTGVAFYQFNQAITATGKFPPHFHQKWFYTAWGHSNVYVVETANGTTMSRRTEIFTNGSFNGPTSMHFGPDGNIYIASYDGLFSSGANRKITKVAYIGAACIGTPIKADQNQLNPNARWLTNTNGWFVNMGAGKPVLVPAGVVAFELRDLMGRKVWEIRHLKSGQTFNMPTGLQHGAMKYRWVKAAE